MLNENKLTAKQIIDYTEKYYHDIYNKFNRVKTNRGEHTVFQYIEFSNVYKPFYKKHGIDSAVEIIKYLIGKNTEKYHGHIVQLVDFIQDYSINLLDPKREKINSYIYNIINQEVPFNENELRKYIKNMQNNLC